VCTRISSGLTEEAKCHCAAHATHTFPPYPFYANSAHLLSLKSICERKILCLSTDLLENPSIPIYFLQSKSSDALPKIAAGIDPDGPPWRHPAGAWQPVPPPPARGPGRPIQAQNYKAVVSPPKISADCAIPPESEIEVAVCARISKRRVIAEHFF